MSRFSGPDKPTLVVSNGSFSDALPHLFANAAFGLQGEEQDIVTKEEFNARLDSAGLKLSDAQKDELYSVYPYLQAMVAKAHPAMPREAEMSVMFNPEVQ